MSEDSSNKGKKPFFVNIEGEVCPWEDETITTEEIADKGGWDVSCEPERRRGSHGRAR